MLRYAVELVVGGGQVVGMSTSTERGSIDRTVSSIGGALGAYENVLEAESEGCSPLRSTQILACFWNENTST